VQTELCWCCKLLRSHINVLRGIPRVPDQVSKFRGWKLIMHKWLHFQSLWKSWNWMVLSLNILSDTHRNKCFHWRKNSLSSGWRRPVVPGGIVSISRSFLLVWFQNSVVVVHWPRIYKKYWFLASIRRERVLKEPVKMWLAHFAWWRCINYKISWCEHWLQDTRI
jgi:hypothetical protein